MITRPIRVQRLRAKGWRMPPNSVYVGRPTVWGNPFMVGKRFCRLVGAIGLTTVTPKTIEECVQLYAERLIILIARGWIGDEEIDQIAGKNLACWCPLGEPCHADVLLEMANR